MSLITSIDLYLKSNSSHEIKEALKSAGFIEEDGVLYHHRAVIDFIGEIYRPTGETKLVDGEDIQVMAAVLGYHVNVRTTSPELAVALDALRTYPDTPVHKWA